jgi:glycosyltransferase involved in cell wall biosynthesis
MNVSLITDSILPEVGGPAYSVQRIGEALCSAGCVVQIYASRDMSGEWMPASRLDCAGLRGDVVHSFGLWTPFHMRTALIAARRRIPFMVSPIGMLEPWSLEQKRLKKKIALWAYQRRILRRADALHATALAEANSIRELGIDRAIAIIPHGIDIPPNPKSSAFSEPADPLKILFLSRIHPKKGIRELLEVLATLRHGRDWRLVIAGNDEGGYSHQVRKLIRILGLAGRVSMVGPVRGSEKNALFQWSDLFVLPTHSENFGIVIAEALAHGVPVITTQRTPWSELESHRCGWWVPLESAELHVALVAALSATPVLLREAGLRGRQLMIDNYSWEKIGIMHREMYSWILGRAVRPSFVTT